MINHLGADGLHWLISLNITSSEELISKMLKTQSQAQKYKT